MGIEYKNWEYNCWKHQRKYKEQSKLKIPLSATRFQKVWKTYTEVILEKMLEGHFVNTPMGRFMIIKKNEHIRTQIDWANTMKHKTIMFHFNDHTDGYKIMFVCLKKPKYRKYYHSATHDMNTKLAAHIKADKNNYKKYETYQRRYTNL